MVTASVGDRKVGRKSLGKGTLHAAGSIALSSRFCLHLTPPAEARKFRIAMKWIPYGPNALLLEFADAVGDEALSRCRAITAELDRHPPAGLVEYVPAFTTLLLEFSPAAAVHLPSVAASLGKQLSSLDCSGIEEGRLHEIAVRYDGPDLARVAQFNGLTPEEVVARHTGPVYRVFMLGFSPGFPYLGLLDPSLHTPRLPNPRPRIAAGSVAIGGEHTGIYTVETPGGWNIIGHTDVALFHPEPSQDAGAEGEMFLLRQGDRVRFIPQMPRVGS